MERLSFAEHYLTIELKTNLFSISMIELVWLQNTTRLPETDHHAACDKPEFNSGTSF
jgi:hypothetical protein